MTRHVRTADIRGASRLVVDATIGLASLVETMHHNILRTPGILGKATQEPASGITGFVYKTVRGVTRLVGGSIDAVLGRLARVFDGEASSHEREAVLAALNGVLGDHLQAGANPLAITMQLRREGQALELDRAALAKAIPAATGKVLLLVHGLCMNDLQWRRKEHDHGAALAADAGFTPVYLHYNTGLHISANGRAFAAQIEALLQAWPVRVDELAILAHSMGGLVARSACHYGELAQQGWLRIWASWFFSARRITARRWNAAATGWTCCWMPVPTRLRSRAWEKSAAPASPIYVSAAWSMRIGSSVTVSRVRASDVVSCRCRPT